MHNYDFNTLFIGQSAQVLPKCHSTNSYLQELLTNSRPVEGSLIVAEEQTAGRGQRGSRWEAAAGENLTFSVLLRPAFLPVDAQFQLTTCISLAIFELLTEFLPERDIRIKWPNDLYAEGSKIAGILIENLVRSQKIEYSIVGIGLNVNQLSFSTAPATSLAKLAGQPFVKEKVLHRLCQLLEQHYLALRAGGTEAQRRRYLEALYWKGEVRTFEDAAGVFSGKIIGVQPSGKLAICKANGDVSYYENKAVRFVG